MKERQMYLTVVRIVTFFWLLGFFCKASFFVPYLFKTVIEYPARYSFFPQIFQSNTLSAFLYVMGLIALGNFMTEKSQVHSWIARIMAVCAGGLLLHINTYNDATFVTSFWVALWLIWFTWTEERMKGTLRKNAFMLGHSAVGVMFLAGFIGKCTPGYLNGQVIKEIFIEQGAQSQTFHLITLLQEGSREMVLTIVARLTVLMEGILALNIFIANHKMRLMSLVAMPVLILFSTWRIISVISPLAGILIALIIWERNEQAGGI